MTTIITDKNIKWLVFDYRTDKKRLPSDLINVPIGDWDVSRVTNMIGLFSGFIDFNEPLENWNVSNVIYMSEMFKGAKRFNQSLRNWNVSKVRNMEYMFSEAISFNQPLNSWNVRNVSSMECMFRGAARFNQPLDNWNVSNLTNMEFMFKDAVNFNQPLWNNVRNNSIRMIGMFQGAKKFNQPLSNWNVSNVQVMFFMFEGATSFNQPLNSWNVSKVENMQNMFKNATSFNQPLDNWNVSNVANMASMFEGAVSFNQPLDNWNVSKVQDMTSMFKGATSFNQPLNNWNVSKVEYMRSIFNGATSFNQPLHNWNISKVQNMASMFEGATSFNQPLNNWNVSNVKDMQFMFKDAISFNQPLNNWNVSKVQEMTSMFEHATSFNQPLHNWNVSKVEYMTSMFKNATSFNQPLHNWNVSNVYEMISMFEGATSFNQPLDNWDVSNVQDMTSMFKGATSFNQKIPGDKSYIDFYNESKPDNVFNQFHEMMQAFNNKPLTINNTNNYMNDAILYEQTNPYLVHYEIFEGNSFPIITILKGTVLFTGRKNTSAHLNTSFFHLYKLHNNPSFGEYERNKFEKALTYFFPIPYMAVVINSDFKTMDMVVLTKDVRLLCMVSPSPFTRGIKTNPDYSDYTTTCPSRDYDMCLTTKLIYGLRLNGYIGIACEDSLKKHTNLINKLYRHREASLLYLSSCFNNMINRKSSTSTGDGFIEKMIDKRTYGIPEVVLIPYDIHTYRNPAEYQTVYNNFASNLTADMVDDSHFIFKPVFHVNGTDTLDVGKNMASQLALMPPGKLQKSLQCFPLLNILKDEVEPDKMDYVVDSTYPATLNDVAFTNSYLTPSTSKCAFETINFYVKLANNISQTGGSVVISENVPLKMESKRMKIMPKEAKQDKDTIIQVSDKNIISDSTTTAYYKEVNGIPVVAIVDKELQSRKSGGTRQTSEKVKTRRNVKTHRKVKTMKSKSKRSRRV